MFTEITGHTSDNGDTYYFWWSDGFILAGDEHYRIWTDPNHDFTDFLWPVGQEMMWGGEHGFICDPREYTPQPAPVNGPELPPLHGPIPADSCPYSTQYEYGIHERVQMYAEQVHSYE